MREVREVSANLQLNKELEDLKVDIIYEDPSQAPNSKPDVPDF